MSRSDTSFFFFFNDTAPTEIYTLSLHDALPIFRPAGAARPDRADTERPVGHRRPTEGQGRHQRRQLRRVHRRGGRRGQDRKSTRLNSSHGYISYAVFCLKKKKNITLQSSNNPVT